MAVAVGLAALAVTIEFTQLWFPPRTVSQNDIIAEAIGGVAGTLLWLTTGQPTAEWLRTIARTRRRSDRFVQLLQLYLVGFIAYAVLPLDLTISSSDLLDKLRNGRLVLVPFSDLRADAESAYGLVRDLVVFFPIGILLSRWRTPGDSQVRSIGMTTLLGALVAGFIELSQVFVLTRYASTTDVILDSVSAFGAALIMQRWAGGARAHRQRSGRLHGTDCCWLLGALAWAVVIVVIFCAPFDVSGSSQEWRERYEGIWAVPFSRLYYSTEYNAVSDVLRKLLMFGGFGALATQARRTWHLPAAVDALLRVAVVFAGTGLALGIEIAQVVLPPHIPDITDVALGALGTLLGWLVATRGIQINDGKKLTAGTIETYARPVPPRRRE